MTIPCPHCAAELTISGSEPPGTRVQCLNIYCLGWVLIGRRADGKRYGVKVGISAPAEKMRKR